MRAFVFTDASLARHAGRFVWLEIDTEKPQNAGIRKKLKINALPTYYVLDPATENVAIRWVGAATVPQLHKLLEDGVNAVRGRGSALDARLAGADSLYGAADFAAAAKAYAEVLGSAPANWSHYPRVVEARLFALDQAGAYEEEALLAREAHRRLGRSTSGFNAAAYGLGAALQLPEDHAQRKAWLAEFEPIVLSLLADATIAVAADDRSSIYGLLADVREDAKDDEGRTRVLETWAGFLEGEAGRARSPEQRTVFDAHRLSAYLALRQPARAVPMLEASEKDFPDDYNPPARLAVALNEMKRFSEAMAASDRAMARAYGPRKLRIYSTRADIHLAQSDSVGARAVVAEALRHAEGLPDGQRSETTIAGLRKRLGALGGPSGP